MLRHSGPTLLYGIPGPEAYNLVRLRFINLIEDGDPYDGPPFGPKDPLESFSEALMCLDLPNRTQGQAGAHQGLGPLGLDARAKLALEFLCVHLRE